MLVQEHCNQHKLLKYINLINDSMFSFLTYILNIFVIHEVYMQHDKQQILLLIKILKKTKTYNYEIY